MIKNNKAANRIYIVVDALILVGAYVLAFFLRFKWLGFWKFMAISEGTKYLGFEQYLTYLYAIVPGYILIYYLTGIYKVRHNKNWFSEAWSVLVANFFGILFIFSLFYFFKQIDLSRKFLGVFVALNCLFDFFYRFFTRKCLIRLRKKGKYLKNVLMVGYSRTAEGYIDRINLNKEWGYRIFGILDDKMAVGTKYKDVAIIDKICKLEEVLKGSNFDEVIITLGLSEYERLGEIVALCEKCGAHSRFIPDYLNVIPTIPDIEDLEGLPVINIRKIPLSDMANAFVKRLSDIVFGFIALMVALIPMIIIAIGVKLSSEGPVLYKQERIGYKNKVFKMYKFRTMVVQDTESEKEKWTTPKDPRVTSFGRFLRKTSLDELPQLFNVLIGNMSLVGPRPERPQYVEKFMEEIPRYMVKHQVRPGMTGWAQVNGFRGDTSIRKRIDYDIYYIENWTFRFDIKILILTLFKGFISTEAY
ncbi:MAG: undecaprenyl-phosphate glucose phosphotransferase [Lachnospiraceae bacterium]|nr:undecaprenyl-phosphate glucose phosphotransferase [Lachnospiraceae bacterium]